MRIVIALGGNALEEPGQHASYESEESNVRAACNQMLEIIEHGHQLVITHGNGPQVGYLELQQSSASNAPVQPLHVLGAMTQGEIGYLIQRELGNLLRLRSIRRRVVSVVTQTLVAKDDPAFASPSKPIGPIYDEAAAARQTARGYVMKKVVVKGGSGFRRVVPSPEPIRILEAELISSLAETGAIVVASGGGGIPVVQNGNGNLEGVDAVIDKDLSAEKLAEAVGADLLLILTNVDRVKLDYGKPEERGIESMTVAEARKYLADGQFAPGSMGPKVLACVRYAEWGGRPGIITSLDKAILALDGKEGTRITLG
ncbi:MAG TPA: carbamate kinase [Nitrososphaerales archaeon]|nr:carbamate kinase [Nitrososphaerales archaeon]